MVFKVWLKNPNILLHCTAVWKRNVFLWPPLARNPFVNISISFCHKVHAVFFKFTSCNFLLFFALTLKSVNMCDIRQSRWWKQESKLRLVSNSSLGCYHKCYPIRNKQSCQLLFHAQQRCLGLSKDLQESANTLQELIRGTLPGFESW